MVIQNSIICDVNGEREADIRIEDGIITGKVEVREPGAVELGNGFFQAFKGDILQKVNAFGIGTADDFACRLDGVEVMTEGHGGAGESIGGKNVTKGIHELQFKDSFL